MNTCAKCGIEVEAEAKFCQICGHDLSAPAEKEKEKKEIIKAAPMQLSMEQFDELLTEGVKQAVDQLGLTKVDRKHLAVPGLSDEEVDQMNGKQKMVALLKAAMNGDMLQAKALSEGTGSAGGFLVPTEFRAEVIKGLEKPGTIRSLTRVIPVRGDAGEIPSVTGNVTVAWTAESATIADSDPTFGQVTWAINKLAGLNKASRELFNDSVPSLGDLLVTLFTEAFVREERNVFATGSGTGRPEGLQNASGITAVAQAGASLALDDITSIYYALASQYRSEAVWFMHDNIVELIDKLKDSNNRPLLQASIADGSPQRLKGRPIIENEYIPTNLGVGSDESLIFFGVPSWYYLFDREEMEVEVSTEADTAFATHQAWTKVIERIDGKLALSAAFVKGTGIK